MKFLPPALFLLMACAHAAEPAPVQLPLEVGTLKLRDGKVYESAKIIGKDAVGVKVTHSGGTGRVAYDNLPTDLAARFPRDTKGAKEQLEKESKAEAAHDRAVDKALAKEAAEEKAAEAEDARAWEKMPDEKGDQAEKIASLEAYVRRLEKGIAEAQAKIDDSNRLAARYHEESRYTVVRGRDAYGNVIETDTTNSSKLTKARYHEKRAARLGTKVAEAQRLIEGAKAKIAALEK